MAVTKENAFILLDGKGAHHLYVDEVYFCTLTDDMPSSAPSDTLDILEMQGVWQMENGATMPMLEEETG